METVQQGDHELIAKTNLKRARRMAISFAVFTGIALISLVYAFVQREKLEEGRNIHLQQMQNAQAEIRELKIQLEKSRKLISNNL